jgi:hypothetical protein
MNCEYFIGAPRWHAFSYEDPTAGDFVPGLDQELCGVSNAFSS